LAWRWAPTWPGPLEAIDLFQQARVLFAPGKQPTGRCGRQRAWKSARNATRLHWSADKVDLACAKILQSIMRPVSQYYGKRMTISITCRREHCRLCRVAGTPCWPRGSFERLKKQLFSDAVHKCRGLIYDDERRRFTRIPFERRPVCIRDEWSISVQLVIVSLRGLFVLQPADWASATMKAPSMQLFV